MFDITKKNDDHDGLGAAEDRAGADEPGGNHAGGRREFPICLEADADNENDAFEQLTAQVVHVTKEGRVMVVLRTAWRRCAQ